MSNQYQASATDLDAIREVCETYGFCLVKGLFAPSDLETLLTGMKAATNAARGRPLSDLLGLPQVRDIYFDPRILEIARALLGPRLVYDGEGTINYEDAIGANTLNPYNQLHCDARGKPKDLGATWWSPTDSIYRAYRFGIYFQDYTRASGSLKVIVGSHRGDPEAYAGDNLMHDTLAGHVIGGGRVNFAETRSPLHNLPSQPGDLVIWNLRTFHSAGARRFIDNPSLTIHPGQEEEVGKQAPHLFAPPPGPRNAIFFDYAAPEEEIDLYIKYRARPTTGGIELALHGRSDDPAALLLAQDNGIAVRHDKLITALALALASYRGPNPVQKLDAAGARAVTARLHALLSTHVEYSPYFPLFDRRRFEKAPTPDAAVESAVRDIISTLQNQKST